MQDIISIQEYLNAIVHINNACIYSGWYTIIRFNELIKKDSFQSSGKLSLFDDCTYEKFYSMNKCGEKSFIGNYVEIISWKGKLSKTCETYFFAGISDLTCSFAKKISNADFQTVSNELQNLKIRKEYLVNRFLNLIDEYFKDDLLGVYSKGIDLMKYKRIEPLDEFVFKSNKGVYILKFEIGD